MVRSQTVIPLSMGRLRMRTNPERAGPAQTSVCFSRPAPRPILARPNSRHCAMTTTAHDLLAEYGAHGQLERIPGASGLVVDDEEHARLVGAIRARARSPQMAAAIDPNLLAADVKTLTRIGGEWRPDLNIGSGANACTNRVSVTRKRPKDGRVPAWNSPPGSPSSSRAF